MSERLSLRPYQEECLDHAKTKNTIACLPTGKGKTLIAARLIEHHLKLYPNKKVAFLVPTRPLVDQQSEYCMNHCSFGGDTSKSPVVCKVFGDAQSGWQQKEWSDAMEHSEIFLGTPAIFQKALVQEKYIRVDHFSLFVFDECHHAVGNSPMAAILRDAISPHVASADRSTKDTMPRILGLTGSFVNGSLKNIVKRRQQLETLMNSTIICPSVELEVKKYHRIAYTKEASLDEHKVVIESHVKAAFDNTNVIKHTKKISLGCSHVFVELGKTSLFCHIDQAILKQIQAKATYLELQTGDEHCKKQALDLRACIPYLKSALQDLSQVLSCSAVNKEGVERTDKLTKLLELLETCFTDNDDDKGYRGIIFVEQVALVSTLAKQINDEFSSRFQCGAIAGTKAQTESDREEQLQAFKDGHVQVLVATSALEEGIDVAECKFVVRYNRIATTKGHIQGAGRARHVDAEIYYFENCPESENSKADQMSSVARNKSLSLSSDELRKANASLRVCIDGVHPYPFVAVAGNSGTANLHAGEVNVFNCKQLLVTYCSRVLGEPISPEIELYDYFQDMPDGSGEKISSIRFPTPEGWDKKVCSDYKSFWAGVDLSKDVFYSDRVKNKTQPEREEMCFVYLVVVELREKGLLDKHNKPVEVDAFDTKRKCPLRGERPPSGFTLKDSVIQPTSKRYKDIASPSSSVEPTVESGNEQIGSQSIYPFGGEDGASVTLNTCKSILNEYITVVLSKAVSFKKLYEYEEMNGRQKVMTTLKFPSPEGWLYIRRAEHDDLCSKIDIEEIAGSGKSLKWREEMTFVYLAVVKLRKLGFIDSLNKACASDALETQKNCPLEETDSAAETTRDNEESTVATRSIFTDANEECPTILRVPPGQEAPRDEEATKAMPPLTEIVAHGRHSPEPSELGAGASQFQ